LNLLQSDRIVMKAFTQISKRQVARMKWRKSLIVVSCMVIVYTVVCLYFYNEALNRYAIAVLLEGITFFSILFCLLLTFQFKTEFIFIIGWVFLLSAALIDIFDEIYPEPVLVELIVENGLVAAGMICVSIGFLTVISNRDKMNEKLNRAEKLSTLGEMAAAIAHEIRNPLTVVKGFLQLMQQKERSASPYFPIVLDELHRAESIIGDYLSFAKPRLDIAEQVDLQPLIENIHFLLQPLALKNGVDFQIRTREGLSVWTDKNQLQQVIVNLAKNAIEATPEGGTVLIRLQNDDGRIHIKITDTGKGMSQEQLKRLGTLFYSTKEKGTGLGTSVSIRMIEMMGGTISFKSEENVGTEVLIAFPPGAEKRT